MKLLKVISLLFIPVCIAVFTVLMKQAAGPYWLGVNSDPAYLYLVNSVYLLDNITPYFTDHPGTTLELLGAIVIKTLVHGKNTAEQVFMNPEYYLNALHYVMFVLYMTSLLVLTGYVWHKTKSIIITMMIQTSAFFFLTLKSYASGDYILPVIVNINSDTLIMTITNLYVLMIFKLFYNQNEKSGWRTGVVFGIICGLGVITKLTFLPLLIFPIIVFPQWKQKLSFIGSFLVTAGIILVPVIPRYQEIFHWIKHISVETSAEGKVVAIMQWNGYYKALKGLLMSQLPMTFLIIMSIVIILSYYFVNKKLIKNRRSIIFIAALTCVLAAQFIMVSRHAGPHYMSPIYGLWGIIWVVIYLGINIGRMQKKRMMGVLLIIFIWSQTTYAWVYYKHLKQTNQDIYYFSQKVYKDYAQNCTVFGFYRSSSLPMAIRFAQGHGNFKYYSKMLKRLYPEALFYNQWQRVFHNFDKNVFLRQVMPKEGCALLYGSADSFVNSEYMQVKLLEKVHGEKLYQIQFSTLDQAHYHYLKANVLEKEKRYKEAYVYAVKALQLGRPNIETYAEKLKQKIIDENILK